MRLPCVTPYSNNSNLFSFQIGVWCVQNYALAYLKFCLAKNVHENKHSMSWFGAAMEMGYFFGNITAFVLVGVLKLFKEKSFC